MIAGLQPETLFSRGNFHASGAKTMAGPRSGTTCHLKDVTHDTILIRSNLLESKVSGLSTGQARNVCFGLL